MIKFYLFVYFILRYTRLYVVVKKYILIQIPEIKLGHNILKLQIRTVTKFLISTDR